MILGGKAVSAVAAPQCVETTIWISAIAAGFAVLGVTWFADKIGGSAGGLLATAPVTTTAAFLYLGIQDVGALETQILQGGASLFAAIAPMPVYFYLLKWTPRLPVWLRISIGVLAYLALFTALTWFGFVITPNSLKRLWFVAVVLLVQLFWFTFMRISIDPVHLRGKKPPLRWPEAILRVGAGMVVILLVDTVARLQPALAGPWAVFPGVFVVTLIVLGLGHGAAFSARAAQAASLGGVPLALFLLTYWFLLPVVDAAWWTWFAVIPAWGAYFGALVPLYKVRRQAYDY